MKTNNVDRRIRKTKALLRQTLTYLMKQKDLKDISISELTEAADINRGTFYFHYKDIYDLFEQIEKEIIEEFISIIGKHNSNHNRAEQVVLLPILLELFHYIADHADSFIAILKTKETTFLTRIIAMCRPQSKEEWNRLFSSGKEEFYEYYFDFMTAGCIALLQRWFEEGMPQPPECMASLAEKMMTNCIRNL